VTVGVDVGVSVSLVVSVGVDVTVGVDVGVSVSLVVSVGVDVVVVVAVGVDVGVVVGVTVGVLVGVATNGEYIERKIELYPKNLQFLFDSSEPSLTHNSSGLSKNIFASVAFLVALFDLYAGSFNKKPSFVNDKIGVIPWASTR
jgi:hypothetical protein